HKSFDRLREMNPSFAPEWTRCQHALQQYQDIIEAGGLQPRLISTASSHPSENGSFHSQDHFGTSASATWPWSHYSSSGHQSSHSLRRGNSGSSAFVDFAGLNDEANYW